MPRVSFKDENQGALLAEVVLFEPIYHREVWEQVEADTIQLRGGEVAPLLHGFLARMTDESGAQCDSEWQECSDEIAAWCFTRNIVNECTLQLLVGCTGSECNQVQLSAVGAALCAVADVGFDPMRLVVEQGGLPAIAAAAGGLVPSGVRLRALKTLQAASRHCQLVRLKLAAFTASGPGGALLLAIVEALGHPYPDIPTVAASLLFGIVQNDKGVRPPLALAGCVGGLLGAMERLDGFVQGQVIELLGNLATATEVAEVAQAVVATMRRFPAQLKVQMSGCATLLICMDLNGGPEALGISGCCSVVACAMGLCRAPVLQKNGCAVLRAMLSDIFLDGRDSADTAAVCIAVVSAIEKAPNAPNVAADGLEVLAAAICAGSVTQAAAETAGGLAAARAAAKAKPDDERVQAAATVIRRALGGGNKHEEIVKLSPAYLEWLGISVYHGEPCTFDG